MPWCKPSEARSELEIVQALIVRSKREGQCEGPLIELTLSFERTFLLSRIFDSEVACDVLWGGFEGEIDRGVHFMLCAAHWFDLACLAWARGLQRSRSDWLCYAEQLLHELCDTAQWDAKEIVNMFSWVHTRLT